MVPARIETTQVIRAPRAIPATRVVGIPGDPVVGQMGLTASAFTASIVTGAFDREWFTAVVRVPYRNEVSSAPFDDLAWMPKLIAKPFGHVVTAGPATTSTVKLINKESTRY